MKYFGITDLLLYIDRSPLNHAGYYRNGTVYVNDLLDNNGTFCCHSKIVDLFNVKYIFSDIFHSLHRNWILLLIDDEFKDNNT